MAETKNNEGLTQEQWEKSIRERTMLNTTRLIERELKELEKKPDIYKQQQLKKELDRLYTDNPWCRTVNRFTQLPPEKELLAEREALKKEKAEFETAQKIGRAKDKISKKQKGDETRKPKGNETGRPTRQGIKIDRPNVRSA